ncbi:TLD-domain-containing protein [Hesseltinella vesiculosa]|uniref:Oxidation resistance protein 1 n=1 Tax=Hesseltinella vesiculosa TaxID=101127 RepID=A0A1X2GHB5_9FUNG|nr:TLD-domain-containing protein [Hesseltinella vesiculosa]
MASWLIPFRKKRAKIATVSPTTVNCIAQDFYKDSFDTKRSLEDQLDRQAHVEPLTTHPLITPSSSFSIQPDYPPVLVDDLPPWTSPFLQSWLAEYIQVWLPSRIHAAHHWHMLYSLANDGCSIQTLYSRAKECHGPMLLVIRTTEDEVIGAYLSEPLKPSRQYYGSGECFLWKSVHNHSLKVYPWTGANEYLIYSNQDFIAIGGGEGQVGLYLHGNLFHGHSQRCSTFANECLSTTPQFECLDIELWQFIF